MRGEPKAPAMRNQRHYGSAVSQVGDRLKQANLLLAEAAQAMVEDRPDEAREHLEHARGVIAGAIVVATWASRLPDKTA